MRTNIQSIKKQGSLNPMYGKSHDEVTRRKISDAQKQRYAAIEKALKLEKTEHPIGNTSGQARLDLLQQCLFTDTIGFKDVQQAMNFIAIMTDGIDNNYLKKVINNELNKHLENLNRHVQ